MSTMEAPSSFDFDNDPSMMRAVQAVFREAILKAFPQIPVDSLPPMSKLVSTCNNAKHGDYQCNAAMPLFQKLGGGGGGGGGKGKGGKKGKGKKSKKKKDETVGEGDGDGDQSSSVPTSSVEPKTASTEESTTTTTTTTTPTVTSPKDVADAIVAAVPTDHPVIRPGSLAVNGPGFVTCRIGGSYLRGHVESLLTGGPRPPPAAVASPETVVVDFSSPNIAKEMHVGHLRSTILGESVCRILEFCGHTVHRVNHVGDWGTQFGMLIEYLQENRIDGDTAGDNITDLTVFYKQAKARFDESPEFKAKSQANVVALQSGDPECMSIWKVLCDVSRREFEKVYKRLSVTVEECGESFYNDKIPGVIAEFEEAGLVKIEEGGAKCVFTPASKVPLMLQKSDGGYGYDSTDMAALRHRLLTLGASRVVVITDAGQSDHFKMCNAAAKMIGWTERSSPPPAEGETGENASSPSVAVRLEHIGFGTVQGEDGQKFKTRSGDTVRLVDLLDEAVKRMEVGLQERVESGRAHIAPDEIPDVAATMGYGAVKYFDLKRNPTSNYKFSYDAMLDTKGDTAVYLLFAHARLESIVAKGQEEHGVDVDALIATLATNTGGPGLIVLEHPSEMNLAVQLHQFTDVVETTLVDMYPYHICEILYKVSIAASEFVTQCRVLGSEQMESRLLLCRATTVLMRKCFDLLSIGYVMKI